MEYREDGPHIPLPPGDERIRRVCELLEEAWLKYRRPCIVAETSGIKGGRPGWLHDRPYKQRRSAALAEWQSLGA